MSTSDDVTVSSGGGDTVTVSAERLQHAADALRGPGTDAIHMQKNIQQALIPGSAFGDVPGGHDAYRRLASGVTDHTEALAQMGLSITDLAARVEAAAQMAAELNPLTKKMSVIPG